MRSTSTESDVSNLAEASLALSEQVTETLTSDTHQSDAHAISGAPAIVRIEIAIPHLDPLDWLSVQTDGPKFYWSGRDEESEIAALGVADSVMQNRVVNLNRLFEQMRRQMSAESPSIRYYGGMRFDNAETGDTDLDSTSMWNQYPSAWFVLPRFEVILESGRSRLVCNLCLSRNRNDIDSILSEIARLEFDCRPQVQPIGEIIARTDVPGRDDWEHNIADLQDAFKTGKLSKTVLARRTTLEFTNKLSPYSILRRLRDQTGGCFRFCFAPNEQTAFVGASPERLYRLEDSHILTEALAGTRPRGANPEHDRQLAEQLIESEKETAEHQFVIDGVLRALEPITDFLRYDESAFLAKLDHLQHLKVRFQGQLRPRVDNSDVLAALHPTPAVAGHPKLSALKFIRKTEPLDRGWYAGPIGWVGADSAEFAVAIRSGLISENCAHLFAGAGIVSQSDAAEEWQEVENKMATLLGALTDD